MSPSALYRALGPVTLNPTESTTPKPSVKNPGGATGPSEFQKLLEQRTEPTAEPKKPELNLSHHAETRIKSRAIPWNPDIERRVISGIDAAQAKGSREALILAGDTAVIANVKSRTVITAMDRTQMKEKIFTNIDSAVLV